MSRRMILIINIFVVLILISSEKIFADEVKEVNDLFNLSIEELMNVDLAASVYVHYKLDIIGW